MDVHPEAFTGMIRLDSLRFSETTAIPPLTAPVFATLQSLYLDHYHSGTPGSPPDASLLATMPNLRHFQI